MFREGDIVEIPLPDGRVGIGWILHVSRYFTNAVGFVVFGIKGELRTEDTAEIFTLGVLGPLYTNISALEDYGWRTVAHQPISESRRALTTRRVGEHVYIGDDCVGSVEELGKHDLRPMLGMGMLVVYEEIARAFGKLQNSKK